MDPYGNAPCRRTATGDDALSPPPSPNLGDDMHWCTCDLCVPSTNAEENICCRAIAELVAKSNDDCIMRHINFPSVCLNTAVLEAAYYAFDELGEPMEGEVHK
ncbi:hypothetical protein HPB50_008526 [Hyalomma asiaticum]|uniref:Uncharacterized protein n=1 Tax=Hyalomma asiaticum TaxID=266040 RepID=A0ACB7RIA8_HYAAI|nr:hypothetical protein HPB50_008526 [Hyalomma asiaticum]